jgi:phage shock protein A
VEALKRNLIQLESKISEAKTKKNMLKARAQAAKANEQLQGMLGGINTSGGMAAFDRMEEKVLQMEARSNAAGELAGADLESQFKVLEAGNVDDDLAALKASMQLGPAQTQAQLPPSQASTPQTPAQKTEVDAELEELRKQLDNL